MSLQWEHTHQNWPDEDWKMQPGLMSLDFLQMVQHEFMDSTCLMSTVHLGVGGGVIAWGICSWHTLGPLLPLL